MIWRSDDFFNPHIPIFFRIFEYAFIVYVVHQKNPYHCGKPRETPRPFHAALNDHQQQVGYQSTPDLYLYSISTFTIKVSKREVLLELLEKLLYCPSLAINVYNILWSHFKVIGQ